MAKKKSPNPEAETRATFMFPSRHQDVMKAVAARMRCKWVPSKRQDQHPIREYKTHVMGRFQCTNIACDTKSWSSKRVAIQIRGYADNGYNAVVFNQRCKTCNQLGKMTLDNNSYVERIAYRIQRWAGVPVERPYYASKQGLPHEQEFCEGCKRGFCQQARNWEND